MQVNSDTKGCAAKNETARFSGGVGYDVFNQVRSVRMPIKRADGGHKQHLVHWLGVLMFDAALTAQSTKLMRCATRHAEPELRV